MKRLLIVFVKNPILGKVKTRLAVDIGDEAALEVYQKLLSHTREVTGKVNCLKWVGYTWHVEENDLWDGENYVKFVQEGEGLGERMEIAFRNAFAAGFESVCIIGSDCYDLQPQHLEAAFEELNHFHVVIGPARDGGYYLLGMRKLHPELFRKKKWSTETVFSDTLNDIKKMELTVSILETLSDIDTINDVPWL